MIQVTVLTHHSHQHQGQVGCGPQCQLPAGHGEGCDARGVAVKARRMFISVITATGPNWPPLESGTRGGLLGSLQALVPCGGTQIPSLVTGTRRVSARPGTPRELGVTPKSQTEMS